MDAKYGGAIPAYPIRLALKNGEHIELRDEEHASLFLEHFNSESAYDRERLGVIAVNDARDRPVRLVVARCDVVRYELADTSTSA